MGVLRGFERRLEGAVEGMFARAFKSWLQPIEVAKAVQRYVEDHKHVTSDGVVVPNEFRITVNGEDAERLSNYGESLHRELGKVVRETAQRRDWVLLGEPSFELHTDDELAVGRFELAGRVIADRTRATPRAEPVDRPRVAPAPREVPGTGATDERMPTAEPELQPTTEMSAGRPPAASRPEAPERLRLEVMDTGATLDLDGGRYTIGRQEDCDLPIDSSTVSRKHAVLVRRNDTWWVFDLGSTNGTRVNGRRASELPIRPGDRIKVGTIVIQVEEV